MTRTTKGVLGLGAAVALLGGIALIVTLRHGFSALDEPSPIEAVVARAMRHWAVPSELRERRNPVTSSPEVLAEARAHFADHCAACHGNDGKGQSGIGRQMYPRTPDLTLDATQSLSDGELFAIIENGVRLTGMPGFGNGTPASADGSWKLVQFIRHLPKITSEEIGAMEALNPKSPEEWRQMQAEAAFLAGSNPAPAPVSTPEHHH